MPKHVSDAPGRRRATGPPSAGKRTATSGRYVGKRIARPGDASAQKPVQVAPPAVQPAAPVRRTETTPGKRAARHRAPAKSNRAGALVKGGAAAGVAVAATGVAVSAGVFSSSPLVAAQSGDLGGTISGAGAGGGADRSDASTVDEAGLKAERARDQVSRSDRRAKAGAAKGAALTTEPGGSMAETEDLSDADPRDVGRALLAEYGFADQFSCLDSLYVSESNWRVDADNPSSSAYGIPQAMTSIHDLPADYYTSAEAQIRWGLDYIERAYGSPCNAWAFKQGHGWY